MILLLSIILIGAPWFVLCGPYVDGPIFVQILFDLVFDSLVPVEDFAFEQFDVIRVNSEPLAGLGVDNDTASPVRVVLLDFSFGHGTPMR